MHALAHGGAAAGQHAVLSTTCNSSRAGRPASLVRPASVHPSVAAPAFAPVPRFILQPCSISSSPSSRLVVAASSTEQQTEQQQQQQQQQAPPSTSAPQAAGDAPSFFSLPQAEETYEVETLKGVRATVVGGGTVKVEYLAKWKDGSPDTWEEPVNLSEDLIRDYEDRWWTACRKADFKTLASMLEGGRQVLSQVVNERGQSALHFAAALGKEDCVDLLLEAGADGNLQDKEGYTPLHMAAGYMHSNTMTKLLEAGMGVQIKDKNGKDVVSLIDDLRNRMPLNITTIIQRMKLEEVANSLTDMMYEEAPISRVLAEQPSSDGKREFLCQFLDGRDDAWVHERDVSPDVIEDYEQGMEVCEAVEVEDMVQDPFSLERKFKVRWSDGYPSSWEPEEHVSEDLIAAFAAKHPQLFELPPASGNGAGGQEQREAVGAGV